MKPRTLTRSPSANSVENRPAKPKPKHPGLTEPKAVAPKRWSERAGERFGRLVVVRPVKRLKGSLKIECICDCGKVVRPRSCNLGKNTNSCGCLFRETRQGARKHGHKSGGKVSKIYRAWQSMKTRCYGHQKINHRYIQNNIRVCEEWLVGTNSLSGFECFAKAVGEPPTKNHTIERIDNLGDYEPKNVIWATRLVQGNNAKLSHEEGGKEQR